MTILNACRQLITSGVNYAYYLTGAENASEQVKKNDDKDGPGAGGGYKTIDRVEVSPTDDDGPGAGGGYFYELESAPSDGPGAGGGYDDSDDTDSDGPGAGGGYNDSVESLVSVSGKVSANWAPAVPTVKVTLADDGGQSIELPAAQVEWLVTTPYTTPTSLPVKPTQKEAKK